MLTSTFAVRKKMGYFNTKAIAAAVLALGLASTAQASFVNGSFESPLGGGAELTSDWVNRNFVITPQANVPGWLTTSPTGQIEIWRQPGPDSTAVPAYNGTRYAELNAYDNAALYQDVSGINAGLLVGWELAHRGRAGIDTMNLTITDLGVNGALGGGDDTVLFTRTFTDPAGAWAVYGGNGIVALGNTIRFSFGAVSTGSGDITIGNLLDAVDFGTHVRVVPEPGSLLLVGAALAAAGAASRRRNKA
jgi:PEP-CTERM motif